ncbi:GntR family transcriptional regulator [Aurantimonas sp. HBX-1]|uniref:GntR family transcriptional regulator n=1 Tax=Aurantimonas sp. HBX-1 TaxID=2906072 RepID=UPI001F439E11|nr:GntR family transcriptional regulator [Aurantimonas sp. HBX-1]UIJ72650.1 GntR family transcriptional regulator [Aurantimonas sp. HBX-1]
MTIAVGSLSIAERSYDAIRADIVFGALAPGGRLKLSELAERYGTSVSTLREIFGRLASEGLIRSESQRGFEVAPISARHLQDVASLRLLLERHALAMAFKAGDLDWEGNVVAAHHKLSVIERRMLAGEPVERAVWKGYDREFHLALIAACGSQELIDAYVGVYDHYLRYQMVAFVFRGAVASDEHRGLMQAAVARDTEAALGLLDRHVSGCVTHTLGLGILP